MWITLNLNLTKLQNSPVNFENLFEDLEAQFENASSPQKPFMNFDEVNLAIVRSKNLSAYELIAPILAQDFVAGLDLFAPTWHIFPFHSVRSIKLERQPADDLPLVRQLNKNLLDFLAATPMPNPAKWRLLGANEQQRSGQIVGVVGSLLGLVDSAERNLVAVPLQSIQQLSIESVDKLNGDF